jgi:tight adherence protein C
MAEIGTIPLVAFLMVSSLVVLVFMLMSGRHSRLDTRLDDLSDKSGSAANADSVAVIARSTLPKMGAPLVPKNEEERTRLQTRLIHAGLYRREAMVIFLGVKMLLMVSGPLIGLAAGMAGMMPVLYGFSGGLLLGVFGMVLPSFWLDKRKANRQACFRRSLPDALDVLVICLEGGLSPPAGIRRVSSELRAAHPMLASELNIVQREIQLGRSTGEALRQFAQRCDLEEAHTLAAVIMQAERFGTSLVKSLRVHAETLRMKRMQYAEEMAQKATVKILFPTIFFIFPGIFIVVLGPAAVRIGEMLSKMSR